MKQRTQVREMRSDVHVQKRSDNRCILMIQQPGVIQDSVKQHLYSIIEQTLNETHW